jgi:hypothetical protein
MSLKVGDPIFMANSSPGIVKKADMEKGRLNVDVDTEAVAKHFRHGYIKGLDENERLQYDSTLDSIEEIKNPKEQISALQEKISQLENGTPSLQQIKMARYLKAELNHIIQVGKINPRFYEVDAHKLNT